MYDSHLTTEIHRCCNAGYFLFTDSCSPATCNRSQWQSHVDDSRSLKFSTHKIVTQNDSSNIHSTSLTNNAQLNLAYDPNFPFTVSVLRQLFYIKGRVRLSPPCRKKNLNEFRFTRHLFQRNLKIKCKFIPKTFFKIN